MPETIVIAGAGHTAGQAVVSLRQGGFQGGIVLVGEEPYLPYQRPPLSKKFLAGEMPVERLLLRQERFYAEHGVEVHLGLRVEEIDRERRRVRLGDDSVRDYDRLLLATGSRVRRIPVPGAELPGIYYLRTIDDVEAIREHFRPDARLVVVGGGYIGLEVAAVAATLGLKVTVLEAADRVMSRVVAPATSAFYSEIHRRAGVDIRCGTAVSGFTGETRVAGVRVGDDGELPADLVIVGVGVEPVTELAEHAGLACDNGILVDEYCETADPAILAAGDCTSHPNSLLGIRLRLESVHNAQEQAKTAAANLCGKRQPYADIPWFWSDQYDLKLQIAGIAGAGYSTVVRGDPAARSFAVFYQQGERIMAVEAINCPREFMLGKKLIAAGAAIPAVRLGDAGLSFNDMAGEALGG